MSSKSWFCSDYVSLPPTGDCHPSSVEEEIENQRKSLPGCGPGSEETRRESYSLTPGPGMAPCPSPMSSFRDYYGMCHI